MSSAGLETSLGPQPPAPEPPPLPLRAKPVAEDERIQTLDLIRGMAVFGILFVNIQDFALVTDARYEPSISGGEGPANHLIWLATYLLADTKFIAIFTLLFGAGIALGDRRRRARRERRAAAYYRRMFSLLLLGLAHGILLWDGDILYYYAAGALLLYFAPRFPAPVLFAVGAVFAIAYSHMNSKSMLRFRGTFSYMEVEVHQAPWLDQVAWRLEDMGFNAISTPLWYAPNLLGMMLIGMALLRWGFLQGRSPTWVYLVLAVSAFPAGIALIYGGTGFSPGFDTYLDTQLFFWGSTLLSLAYISAAIALSMLLPRFLPVRAVAAAGRMALTNYLTHSVICTTLFYGYGFGLYGKMDRTGLLGVVLAICLAQLILSPLWLRAFRYGPCEWVWRCVTYWRLQPLKRVHEAGTESSV